MAVATFNLNVPQKTAPGEFPITHLRLVVSLESEATGVSPVTFRVTDPEGTMQTAAPLSTGVSSAFLAFAPAPPGTTGFDVVQIVAPANTLPAGDPGRRRYVFTFSLLSDYDPNNNCSNTMPADETWAIAVTAGPQFTSACLISFDLQVPGNECQAIQRPIPLGEDIAEIVGFENQEHSCQEYRPPLDVVLVLDKSGSMNSTPVGAASTKIESLRNAVTDFVTIWNDLRTTEGLPAAGDQIGVSLFDGNANWWSVLGSGLHDFATEEGNILTNVGSIAAGGSTSIGDGLLQADGVLNTVDTMRRRVILLMSDGLQNTDQMVGVNAAETEVFTYPNANPANQTLVPNQANYQIYTVTVGPSAGVNAEVKFGLANATGGFYINSEEDPDQLSPFFLELLQNFVRFNTWQTARLIHDTVTFGTPYQVTIPISTTTQHVSFALRWPERMGFMRLHVTPAGEPQPTTQNGNRTIVMNFDLPTSPAYNYMDEWLVEIELADPSGHTTEIPFNLAVLVDDVALDVDMEVGGQRYAPGDQVQLEARVRQMEQPVTALGTDPRDRLLVRVVKPGVSIGDLLSDSNASTNQPFEGDTVTAANAKLHNELQENPQALVRDDTDTVTLSHVGEGVYRGSYQAQEVGHYNFVFGLEGNSGGSGFFSRMQIKTIHVRPLPDPDATEFQTQIQTGDGNRLIIQMTPRTAFNSRLGPGLKSQFWFTTPNTQPVGVRDNLDGTYSAVIPFSGPRPPRVAAHFIDLPMVIDEDVRPQNLPVPLDDSTVFNPTVGPGDEAQGCLYMIIQLIRRITDIFSGNS